MPNITIKQLLEAGVHFGHQTKRWNPKMKEYIFGERNGIYIIDLQKTLKLFRSALEFVIQLAAQGKIILFVGTKRQAQDAIAEEAKRCGMYHVNQRWLGGLLTNFSTIQKSIQRLNELKSMKESGQHSLLSKKEISRLDREEKKLEKYLSGIKDMRRLPDAIFIIDSMKENIAIREAKRLNIPVIGVVDTNCDPEQVDYVIPANDDALKSVKLIASAMADAVIEGQHIAQALQAEAQAAQAQAEALRQERPAQPTHGTSTPATESSGVTAGVEPPGTSGEISEKVAEGATPRPGVESEEKNREPRRRFDRRPRSSQQPFEKSRSKGPTSPKVEERGEERRPATEQTPAQPQQDVTREPAAVIPEPTKTASPAEGTDAESSPKSSETVGTKPTDETIQ